jgi:hypothetical protein
VELDLGAPVRYRYVDRVYGEQVRPFTVIPPVALSLPEHALVFGDAKPRKIEVAVKSNGGKVSGDLRLDVPAGWSADPASRHFELTASEEQTNASFNLVPPAGDSRGRIRAIAQVGAQTGFHRNGSDPVSAHHDSNAPSSREAVLVRADIRILSKTVGYVMGAATTCPSDPSVGPGSNSANRSLIWRMAIWLASTRSSQEFGPSTRVRICARTISAIRLREQRWNADRAI